MVTKVVVFVVLILGCSVLSSAQATYRRDDFADYCLPRQDQSAKIKIVIIDSGIDESNQLLMRKVWVNPNEIYDGKDDDGNGCIDDVRGCDVYSSTGAISDNHGHGTFIAGMVAGHSDAAWLSAFRYSDDIEIIPVRAFTNVINMNNESIAACTPETITRALKYVLELHQDVGGPMIIIASWVLGGHTPEVTELMEKVGNAGILIVAAAGNNGNNAKLSYPASLELPQLISVAALDGINLAYYSSIGADIAAQGTGISSYVLNGYKMRHNGTSLAGPSVAMAAASIWLKDMTLKADEVKKMILDRADMDEQLSGKITNNRKLNFQKAISR